MNRRLLLATAAAAATLATLSACSGPYTVSADVKSFGQWPQDRAAGTYAFDRLPSQTGSKREDELEASAAAALAKAGFTPAANAKSADVLVTLGARVTAYDPVPWNDPLWWHWRGNIVPLRYGALHPIGPGWRDPFWDVRYDRSVAILMRDRATGQAIFESHASSDGSSAGDKTLMGALFEAALAEFPKISPETRRVSVQAMR